MASTTQTQDAYAAGWAARQAGEPRTANPFTVVYDLQDWNFGWDDAPATATPDGYSFAAAFEPNEAVLVPCTVRTWPRGQFAPWGRARISTEWESYDVDFAEGAVGGGHFRGVIERAAAGLGKWDVRIDNGLAGAVVTMPESLIVRAPAQLVAA